MLQVYIKSVLNSLTSEHVKLEKNLLIPKSVCWVCNSSVLLRNTQLCIEMCNLSCLHKQVSISSEDMINTIIVNRKVILLDPCIGSKLD
jgi:hypothetical protein